MMFYLQSKHGDQERERRTWKVTKEQNILRKEKITSCQKQLAEPSSGQGVRLAAVTPRVTEVDPWV